VKFPVVELVVLLVLMVAVPVVDDWTAVPRGDLGPIWYPTVFMIGYFARTLRDWAHAQRSVDSRG